MELPTRTMLAHTTWASPSLRVDHVGEESVESRPEAAPRPPPLRSIVVPLDGTPAAEHALPYALALARRSGAEVTLVHIYSTFSNAVDPERLGCHAGDYFVEPLRDYLEALAARLEDAAPVRVRTVVLRGNWADDGICSWSDWEADLVVMTRRRRGWLSRLWHDSISTEVARRSRTPVLLVPDSDSPLDLEMEPPLDRILIPLDGTARAEKALGSATALATLTGGRCELLHITLSRPYAVDWSLAYGGPRTCPVEERAREARCYLHALTDRLKSLAVPVRGRVVVDERPVVDAIAHHAKKCEADVIALASRGGMGWTGLFRGSLAVRLARRSKVPVLICRS